MSRRTRVDQAASAAGPLEAIALSLATVAPTLAMSVVTPLVAQAAGRAVPLAFALGGVAMLPVALAFLAFSRRITDAGSAQAYVRSVFGARIGFVIGWTMLLFYAAAAIGGILLVATFAGALLAHAGRWHPPSWPGVAAAALLVLALAPRRLLFLTRLMIAFEGAAMLAVLVLVAVILAHTPASAALLSPLSPEHRNGLPGLGVAIVFAVLSFAGFEAATTLSEETRGPRHTVPFALLAALGVATLFFVGVSYAEVIGYGANHTDILAAAVAPLDALASRYLSGSCAIFLDLAVGIGAFSLSLAATTAAARLLAALSRDASSDPSYTLGRPLPIRGATMAVSVAECAIALAANWLYGLRSSDTVLTIGVLALIPVYIAVGLAHSIEGMRSRRLVSCGIGLLAALCLAWPLWCSIYPVPPWPADLWPIVVLVWIAVGCILAASRRRQPRTAVPVLPAGIAR